MLDSHLTDPLLRRPACAPDGLTACSHGQRGLEALEQMLLTLPGARVGLDSSLFLCGGFTSFNFCVVWQIFEVELHKLAFLNVSSFFI